MGYELKMGSKFHLANENRKCKRGEKISDRRPKIVCVKLV